MRILVTLASIVIASATVAQTTPPPPTASPPSWTPRDPLALPGDNLPPTVAAVVGPPQVPNPNALRPPPAPSPPLDLAINAAQAAIARCRADGYEVGVAVSNSVGGMVVGLQAEGAFPGRVYNAIRKNLVAIEYGLPSSTVRAKLRAGDFATLARVRPNMTLIGGAIPILADGKLVGAIAVSGAPAGERDEICAAAGAALFGPKP